MWLIAPALATVTALVALWIGLRKIAEAAMELRHSLRRTAATAVAGNELLRAAEVVLEHAAETSADAAALRRRDVSRDRHEAHR